MSNSPWPAWLIPKRGGSILQAIGITLAALAVSVAARVLALGPGSGLGAAPTYFPAFVIITLYAGPRWGWLSVIAVAILAVVAPTRIDPNVGKGVFVLFIISAALVVGVAATLRDALTRLDEADRAQRAAQQALEHSETRLRLIQDAGGVGLWDVDLLTDKGFGSSVLYRNLGLPEGTVLNMDALLSVIHPDDRERVRASHMSSLRGDRITSMEYRVVHPDGTLRWLYSRGEMSRDHTGRVIRALGVNIDVTERRLAFDQVLESEARFRALADSAPVMLWVSRPDGSREFVNRAYVDFLGSAYEEALAFDWRRRLHAEDVARILEEQEIATRTVQYFTLEARYERADGEWRWINSLSQPRYSVTGEFIGYVGIGFDVTASKKAEADLKGINELLAERVAETLRERDVAEAALRQSQKLEAVGQLTGGVAHDFNNLLTVVIGALDMMQRHPDDSPRRLRMIEAALGAARRGERLTQQLLAFSRRQALKPQTIILDESLAELEPLLRRAVGEAVNLNLYFGVPSAVARIDLAQLESAVMNLVVNARDAVTQGGTITIETTGRLLADGEVSEIAAGDYLVLAVHDTGVGMDTAVIGRAFEPFFTTKQVGKGTGLGLSQVYGFARQSGGGACIESARNKGTTVRLYLPRALEASPPEPPENAPSPPATAPSLEVLLVEDDTEVGEIVAAMLFDLGHQVTWTENADQALSALETRRRFDLMLTDLVMPGDRNGVDLAHEAVRMRPGLPIILSSGYTGETLGTAERAPWPLLRKPYDAALLAQTIEALLEPAAPGA